MAPTGSSHLNAALAVGCAGGGLFGYAKAKSVPSVSEGRAALPGTVAAKVATVE